MSDHSPGPWEADARSGESMIVDARKHYVAKVYDAEAARLIAAAPELLEALKGLLTAADCMGDGACPAGQARALIARIEGAATPPAEPAP